MKILLRVSVLSLSLVVLTAVFLTGYGSVYYVKNAGNDRTNGRSDENAWLTLDKAVSSAKNGDTILLKRNDIFREQVRLPDRVTLKDYGTAEVPPVISGAAVITGWTPATGNPSLYSAPVSNPVSGLFVDGAMMRIARYPNSGWLRTTSNNNTSTVVSCDALTSHPSNANDYWAGCRMRWRHWSWYFDSRVITAYSSDGTLTLAGHPANDAGNGEDGWGFYIDGKLSECDTAGEWFYDPDAGKVYLVPPAGLDISKALVEGITASNGVSASGSTVEGIWFRHFASTGLELTRSSTVTNCRFSGIGGDSGGAALSVTWDASGIAVRNCTFENCLNLAVSWVQNPAYREPSFIANNSFRNIGSFPGYGGSGPWHAAGIIINAARNIHIQYNTFDTIGYAAVIFGSPGNFAEYNIIRNAMRTLNDGAGIYTNCDSSTIRHNIITGGSGGWESTGWEVRLAHGIWPEFLEHFKDNIIDSNTCADNNGNGIFLPNNFHSMVRGNVCYGNLGEAQLHIEGGFYTGDNLPMNNMISGNYLYTLNKDGMALTYRPEYDYGTISGNYYCNPFSDNVIGQYEKGGWSVSPHTLTWWRTGWEQYDKNSRTDIIRRPSDPDPTDRTGTSILLVNSDTADQTIPLPDNGIYRDLDSAAVNGGIQLAPFTSRILVHTGEKASVNKPVRERGVPVTLKFLASDRPHILITLDSPSELVGEIFDLKGRCVFRCGTGHPTAGAHRLMIPEQIPPGIYTYRVWDRDKTGGYRKVTSGTYLFSH